MNFIPIELIKHYLIFLILALFSGIVYAQEAEQLSEDRAQAMHYFIEGVSDFENEDYEQALDKLTMAHLKFSDDPGINYALSDVYLATGDLTNAAYYAGIAADLDPENKWYHLQLAHIHHNAGRPDAAVSAYKNILEHHPNDTNILYELANRYVDYGELEESNKIFDKILSTRGDDFEIRLKKFQNYHAMQQSEAALDELNKMREIDPGNLTTLHTISQYYLQLNKPEAAEEVLLDARERNARDPQTLILLAEIYIENQDWEKMSETFISMLRDPLIYPSQKLELVRFIYNQQQSNPGNQVLEDQTARVLLAFSESEPEFGPAQLLAAEYLLQNNQPEEALNKLERVTEIMPENAEAWSQRIQTMFSLQKYEEVIDISEEADEASPDNAFIQFFTGASYMLTDRPEKAEEWLKKATGSPAQRNLRSVIYGTLGDVKQDLDKWDQAKEAYDMALRLDRNNHNALNNYAYYLSVREERLDEAKEMSERALSFEPENSAYLDTLGWIYFKLGEYNKAKDYIQQSVDTGDASAEVYEHLGDVYEALGDYENAAEWWEKALEEDPSREYLKDKLD